MLVRPQDLEQSTTQDISSEAPAPEVAEPEAAQPVVEAGPAPAEVVAPDLQAAAPAPDGAAPEVGETASEQAFANKPTGDSAQLDGGMFEPEEYQAACTAAGVPDKWDAKYSAGHTSAAGWSQPYDNGQDMAFTLSHGHSASQAVKDFLAGPTIADYRVIGVANEMNELRDELGDQQFDQMFGSADSDVDSTISGAQRLKITADMYTIPFQAQMLALAAENSAAQNPTDEVEAPEVEARVEEKPEQAGTQQEPAPEMIADELGVGRERELEYA